MSLNINILCKFHINFHSDLIFDYYAIFNIKYVWSQEGYKFDAATFCVKTQERGICPHKDWTFTVGFWCQEMAQKVFRTSFDTKMMVKSGAIEIIFKSNLSFQRYDSNYPIKGNFYLVCDIKPLIHQSSISFTLGLLLRNAFARPNGAPLPRGNNVGTCSAMTIFFGLKHDRFVYAHCFVQWSDWLASWFEMS